jgi:hypothetical protein
MNEYTITQNLSSKHTFSHVSHILLHALGYYLKSFFTAVEIVRRSGFNGLIPSALFSGWTPAVWSIVLLKTVTLPPTHPPPLPISCVCFSHVFPIQSIINIYLITRSHSICIPPPPLICLLFIYMYIIIVYEFHQGGGMLTATSIRLTDNMVKTFATAAAIVIT